MKGICPNCEKETELDFIRKNETVEVRGESIEVTSEFYRCTLCGEEFENTRGTDSLTIAYQKYRHQHDMLQPEEIRAWRKQYGLTQNELSQILGWGGVTLSRYENGALHSEAHEKILRLAMEPHNLITLIEESPYALPQDKRVRIINELRVADAETYSFERFFEERIGQYEPDEFSGFRKLDPRKLFNTILFFCVDGQPKTKLNKLLFYADFKHFKVYSISITGARYVHLQYGPVPDDYDYFFAELSREQNLDVIEEIYGNYTGFNCKSKIVPDASVFEQTELKVIEEVSSYFHSFGSAKIMEFSHGETGYVSTNEGETISYMYAKDLRI